MKVIERYILRRTVAIFLAALIWVLVIAWTTQVLNRIDIVTGSGQSAIVFFVIASLLLVPVIPLVMPFAIGIAVSQTLSTMNQDSELAVLAAAGSSRWTVIRPILLMAVAISVSAFTIGNTLEPYARQELRRALSNINADIITSVAQEGVFYKIADDLFVQISERLPDGQLAGIFVADTRDRESRYVYHALRGATIEHEGAQLLVLQDGVLQRETADGRVSTVNFDSYSLDLAQFNRGSVGPPQLFPKDRYLSELMNPDINDRMYLSHPQRYRAELHSRYTEWLYSIVFALIAIAVAGDARSFREARLHPTVTAMTISLAVRWAGFYVEGAADQDSFFVGMLYVIPIGMILICLCFILRNKTMELPTALIERIMDRFQTDSAGLSGFLARLGLRGGRA